MTVGEKIRTGGVQPGERLGGRQKGTPNKRTVQVKEALEKAFRGIGGTKALMRWAVDNPGEFYKLWVKMLPRNMTVKIDEGEDILSAEVRERLNEVDGKGRGFSGEAGGIECPDVADAGPLEDDQLASSGDGGGQA